MEPFDSLTDSKSGMMVDWVFTSTEEEAILFQIESLLRQSQMLMK